MLNVTIYRDERDAILAKWNQLQAKWGVGKGESRLDRVVAGTACNSVLSSAGFPRHVGMLLCLLSYWKQFSAQEPLRYCRMFLITARNSSATVVSPEP